MNGINNFNLKDVYSRGIQKKPEEKGKGEEVKPEESSEKPVVEPRMEKVTAKADEILESYAKAAMLPQRGVGEMNASKFGAHSSEVSLQRLIKQWNTTNEMLDNQAKFDLLSQIIDAFGNNEEGAAIWRARRLTVARNMKAQAQMEYLQRLNNGEPYNPDNVPQDLNYEGFHDDISAYNNYFEANYANLTDEQKIVSQEQQIALSANVVLARLINLRDPNCIDPVFERKAAFGRAASMLDHVINCANNPENAGEKWCEVFQEQYRPIWDKFRQGIFEGTLSRLDIEELVRQMQDSLEKLRAAGCPYCDQLLIAIQGCLAYAKCDDIDVLPYPEQNP